MSRFALLLFTTLSLSACGPTSIGTGTVGGNENLIPPMPPHVSSFQKWEHLCFGSIRGREGWSARIAEAGQQGWEMVAIGEFIMCFKRQAPPSAPGAPAAAR